MTSDLVFLTRGDCVQTTTMRTHLDEALQRAGLDADYRVVDLHTLAGSDVRRGYPTPTLLYRGQDVFGLPVPQPPLPEPT